MHELNIEAWDRWVAYRKAIKKAIKPASEPAMKLKLQRYGENQAAVVEQSIANQYQGLFDLKVAKPAPGERPAKTSQQKAKDDADWQAAQARSERAWTIELQNRVGKLKLAAALLARYTVQPDAIDQAERMEWLKGRIGELVRENDPAEVLGDPGLRAMVLQLWSMQGIRRLEARCATPNGVTAITQASPAH